jgi:hypothetical protein
MEELVIKSNVEISECINTQKGLCKEKGYPHFAPLSGTCWKCGRSIYQNYKIVDRSDERLSNGYDGKKFVTGCPHCNKSYCD